VEVELRRERAREGYDCWCKAGGLQDRCKQCLDETGVC
jgi:hypothetical protein